MNRDSPSVAHFRRVVTEFDYRADLAKNRRHDHFSFLHRSGYRRQLRNFSDLFRFAQGFCEDEFNEPLNPHFPDARMTGADRRSSWTVGFPSLATVQAADQT
jgi:hypothetical protein